MSLRYVPDSTKVSPFEMVIRSLKKFEKDKQKEEKKRLESYSHIMLMQKLFNLLGVENSFMNMYMNGYLIEDIRPKKMIVELNTDMFKEIFSNGFDKVIFDREYKSLFADISQKYNTTDRKELVVSILKANEIDNNNNFINSIVANTPEEFIANRNARMAELKLANMILLSSTSNELKSIEKELKNNNLLDMMTNNEDFIKMKKSYNNTLINEIEIKKDNKNKQDSQKNNNKIKIKLPF